MGDRSRKVTRQETFREMQDWGYRETGGCPFSVSRFYDTEPALSAVEVGGNFDFYIGGAPRSLPRIGKKPIISVEILPHGLA